MVLLVVLDRKQSNKLSLLNLLGIVSCALPLQHFRHSPTHSSWYLEMFNISRFNFFNIKRLDDGFQIQIKKLLCNFKLVPQQFISFGTKFHTICPYQFVVVANREN